MNGKLPVPSQKGLLPTETTRDIEPGTRSRKLLLFATLITLALWFVPYSNYLLYPLRLFVTFVHESGHALSALFSGGNVVSMRINSDGSGVTLTRQSEAWLWLTYSGGYLGTALFGALLLQVGRLGKLRHAGRLTLFLAGMFLAGVTLLWGWHDPFTLISGLALSALLFGMGRFLSQQATDFAAAFLAVQCSLNALGDLRILLHLTSAGSEHNDAAFMAQHYPLPPVLWASVWGVAAAIMLMFSLRSYWRATAAASATPSARLRP